MEPLTGERSTQRSCTPHAPPWGVQTGSPRSQERASSCDPTVWLCRRPYGGPSGERLSYQRSTPVHGSRVSLTQRSLVPPAAHIESHSLASGSSKHASHADHAPIDRSMDLNMADVSVGRSRSDAVVLWWFVLNPHRRSPYPKLLWCDTRYATDEPPGRLTQDDSP